MILTKMIVDRSYLLTRKQNRAFIFKLKRKEELPSALAEDILAPDVPCQLLINMLAFVCPTSWFGNWERKAEEEV